MSLRVVARLGLPLSPRRRFFFVSAVVHVTGAIALIVIPTLRGSSRTFEDPIVVQLAAPPAPRAAAPEARATPPAPKPTPPKPAPAGPSLQPEPEKAEIRKPKKEEKKPPEPLPEPVPETQTPAAGVPDSTSDLEPAVGAAESAAIAPLEGGDEAFAWYRASVTAALYGRWQRPILSGLREEIEVRVVFEILRDGTVLNARIDASSGFPALDRSALRAVADASPLPELPTQWSEATLPAGFVFRLFPEEI